MSAGTQSRPAVFLSYARGDDDDFVARAYAFLLSRGLDVWWDKQNMPSRSLTFTEEIRDAIHRSERLMVVIGPKALRSDYVRAEWQAALSEHKPVIPILRRVPDGIGDPYSCLPAELRLFHAPSFLVSNGSEPPLDPLEKILTDPVPPPVPIIGRPPERPPHFRPRIDKFQEIFSAVLGELTTTRVVPHEAHVTVVTGMGGVGKTVLAASLVEAMRSRPSTFLQDGVYWLSGAPLVRLAKLCGASAKDLLDETVMSEMLSQHLSGKRFLLVVDNATAVDQIAPLVRLLGSGGRMLVTTRYGELAVGRTKIDVDRLREEDALQLVADWLESAVEDLPVDARHMLKLCGYHPFAISLNAAAVNQGLAWSTIIAALERHRLDFAAHRFDEYVYATVAESLAISLDALAQPDRARYRELAAFFWDAPVPARAIARFWEKRSGLPDADAQRLMVFLQQRSLIQLHGVPERYEVRLHDLHRAFIAPDEAEVTALRDSLIESYQPADRDAWWSVADDGYFREQIVRHLSNSRAASDVLTLLAAEDANGRNRWYRARADADGFAGYVTDIQVASAHVSDALLPLITSSLRSLAQSVPSQLLGAAVSIAGWSQQQAMARARLPGEAQKRAAAMIALLPHVEDRASWLDETLDEIAQSEVGSRNDLIESLAAIADATELSSILRAIVGWVHRAASAYERTNTAPLAHHVLRRIPQSLAGEAIEIVSAIRIRPLRLYGYLPEPERSARIRSALDDVSGMGTDMDVAMRAATVSALAEHLDIETRQKLVAESLESVVELEPGVVRQRSMLDLLPHLTEARQSEVLDELIASARDNPRIFKTLAEQAPPNFHARLREAVETQRLAWVAHAAPAFTGEHRAALVERALSEIENRDNAASLLWMDDALLTLAMSDSQLDRCHRLVDAQLKDYPRVAALIAIARARSGEKRENALRVALEAIDALAAADDRERGYEEIAPLLTPRQLAEALALAERIGEPSGIEHIPKMLSYLSPSLRDRALKLLVRYAQTTPVATWYRMPRAIPPGLENEALDRLVELARGFGGHVEKADLLTALVTRVKARDRARITEEAREAIVQCEWRRTRIELLLELGCVDDAEGELQQAIPTMDSDELAARVAKLAYHLSDARRDAWVDRAIKAGAEGKYVLDELAPHLTLNRARSYLAFRVVPEDPMDRLRLYQTLGEDFTVLWSENTPATAALLARRMGVLGDADGAFDLLRLGRNDEFTAAALVELAPYLSRDRVLFIDERIRTVMIDALAVPARVGRTILSSGARGYLAGRLAPSLARVGETDRAFEYAHETDEQWRAASYLGIAKATNSDAIRMRALLEALATVLGLRAVFRSEQLDGVAAAIAGDAVTSGAAWPIAVEWARAHPRHEAIEVLAAFSPVAAAIGGTSLPDEVYAAIEHVLRWWP